VGYSFWYDWRLRSGAQGVLHPPTSLASITTAGGHLYKLDPSSDAKQVVDPRVAYIVER